MRIYLVGGAVRDTLLGRKVQDRDWVVVGATVQDLLERGFTPVGRDFPVFLHPRSKEQYALARTERKTAPGYRGFAIHAAADVTLEQDLARRDLTINAVAVDAALLPEDGSFDPAQTPLIDPFHGQRDLRDKQLRHVSDAFREDPVRILRVARFAARFADFDVAAETTELMRAMVAQGEAATLVAERVWQELARGLMEGQPSRMLEVLQRCGALTVMLPELPALWHCSGLESAPNSTLPDAPVMRGLDSAARLQASLSTRFACLCLGRPATVSGGKLDSDRDTLITSLCDRLRVPAECRELALVLARERHHIHRSAEFDAAALVRLLGRCDAFRKPDRFGELLLACACDAATGATGTDAPYPPRRHLLAALAAATTVSTEVVATLAQRAGISGKMVGEMIRQERVNAVAAMTSPGGVAS